MSAFHLGRMRHLDLLALYHRLHPDGHENFAQYAARMSKDRLAATLASPA